MGSSPEPEDSEKVERPELDLLDLLWAAAATEARRETRISWWRSQLRLLSEGPLLCRSPATEQFAESPGEALSDACSHILAL